MIPPDAALAFNELPILEEVDQLNNEIAALRPLPAETEQRILQKLRLEWNYHSNAIEGNSLSYGETVAFLMHGLTAKGKPLKDHLDIRGHNEAINFLLGMVKDSRPMTETDIRNLHKMVLVEPYDIDVKSPSGIPTKKTIRLGKYKQDPNHVETATGEIHYYASPEETVARMGDLIAWYQQANQEKKLHPLVIASLFHHAFVAIHPFDDGNGRVTRLLTNLILMRYQFPPVVVKQEDRRNYYQVLSQADVGEYEPLVTYFGNLLRRSLTIYLKGAKGDSLVEAEDVDKAIALFKKSLGSLSSNKLERSDSIIKDILKISILPLIQLLSEKCAELNDLFVSNKSSTKISVKSLSGKTTYEPVATWLEKELNDNTESISSIFSYQWFEYKRATYSFDVYISLFVVFRTYEYDIFSQQLPNGELKNLYSEQLTPEEMNQIVKEILGKVMAEIKQKAENQSS